MEAARQRLKNEFENADFSAVQSETLSHIISHFATKTDLQVLRTELRGEMRELTAKLRGEMAEFRGEMRGEMAAFRGEVRGEMAAFRGEVRGELQSLASKLEAQISDASEKTQRTMVTLIIALGAVLAAINLATHFMQ